MPPFYSRVSLASAPMYVVSSELVSTYQQTSDHTQPQNQQQTSTYHQTSAHTQHQQQQQQHRPHNTGIPGCKRSRISTANVDGSISA
jgi:hypothetical protein